MAVTQQILKIARAQAVVKMVSVGGGQSNISLASLKKSDETIDFANTPASVTISGQFNDLDGQANISRAGNAVLLLTAGQSDKWDFNQAFGFVLNDGASSNINVNFTANGTIILVLNKSAGYSVVNEQILKDYER